MIGTSVPEASVNEDSEMMTCENYISPYPLTTQNDGVVLPKSIPQSVSSTGAATLGLYPAYDCRA